ncbi:MAG: FliH/SctL family protein [Acidimicrobiales bacterium]
MLRGEAGRRATTETFGRAVAGRAGQDTAPLIDPFAAARAAGFQEGFAAGVADAASGDEAALAARTTRLTEALIAAAEETRGQREAAVTRAEAEAVELAFELAEALITRELSLSSSAGIDAVTRAVALVPEGEDLVVRLHPGDVVTPEQLQALVPDTSVKVVHDPDIEPGGCVVEAGPCRIDAQIRPAIERARALLDTVGPSGPAQP